ncbi:uncharacterized protein LOC127879769 [Dreissena polymorpha]|uniref:uncharacterized protein LOC127879769 n=1 Tax=Dreissena polymorpha TaxID=45954 RepID=UPI002263DAF4|nr:uncharacterized protein LOC127879769 [Dreissena polymorpha]
MKMYLRTILCFVFVAYSQSQGGYEGRARIVNKPFIGNQIQHDIGKAQVVGGQLRHDTAKAVAVGQQLEHDVAKATIGGGVHPGVGNFGLMGIANDGMMPDDISSVIGSTILGRPLTAGEMIGNVLLPRHGGTLNPDGIANGFGAVMPNGPYNLDDGWTDPLQGMPYPSDFNGQELVLDPITNRYVYAPGSVGHQVVKGGMGPVNPTQHNIVKATVGAVNPIQHDIAKASIGGVIPAGKPIFNDGMVNRGPFGVSAGTVGVDHPSVISHNIGKATLGADAVQGHNIAKAAQVPVGTGFINPNGHVARKIEGEVMHDVAKSGFGGPMVGGAMVGVQQHGMIGISPIGGIHRPGVPMGVNVVHDVNKIGASGVATIGHDPLASSLGHGLAKGSIGDAANIIDMKTGGAVSMDNPIANAAAANLARESLHVAQKTIGLTSGGNPVKAPTGYAGRSRD